MQNFVIGVLVMLGWTICSVCWFINAVKNKTKSEDTIFDYIMALPIIAIVAAFAIFDQFNKK